MRPNCRAGVMKGTHPLSRQPIHSLQLPALWAPPDHAAKQHLFGEFPCQVSSVFQLA